MMFHRLVQRSLSTTTATTATAAKPAVQQPLSALLDQLTQEASQGLKSPQLLQSVSQQVRDEPETFAKLPAPTLAKLAWNYAWLNQKDEDLFVKVANQVRAADQATMVQLSWAFAANDVLRLPQIRNFFSEATVTTLASKDKNADNFLPLLYTCVAWIQADKQAKHLPQLLEELTGKDLSRHAPTVVSVNEKMSTQEEIGLVFRNLVMDKAVAVDVVTDNDITADVVWPARSVVLDVVTLEEDLLKDGKELNGQAQLKQRLLRESGWEVHTIQEHAFEAKFGTDRALTNLEQKKRWLAEHWWAPKV
ncbi:hypothetical protein BASA81_003255 [Batrachochytrium salamandrivorans]|nr:hypothetical protein BASA81_003255 [Batrachochytrium salamandrivorans]